MNCRQAEEQLSRALDGELAAGERQALDAHIASCPECRALKAEWERAASFLREPVVPAQTPEALWADVQRAIRLGGQVRLQDKAGAEGDASVFGWRLRWAGAILAVVLLGAYGVGLALQRQAGVVVAAAHAKAAEVEFVETDLPGASPMVYEDAETGLTVIWVAVAEPPAGPERGT